MPKSSKPQVWRKKPKQNRAINTSNIIIEAAGAVFAAKGFHNTKSEDIAKRAGVGVASLYDYFPNKTAIALALLEKTTFTIIDDTRKIFQEHGYGTKPFQESLPHVVNSIFQDYKLYKNVLIDLVAEVPELRAAEIYSIDRLIHQASLIFLRMYMDEFVITDLTQAHAFVNLVFSSAVKKYLSQPPEDLSEEMFLDHLCQVLITFLMGTSPS